MPERAAVDRAFADPDDVVVEMPVANGAVDPAPGIESPDGSGREPLGRFRRRLERFKGIAEAGGLPGSLDDEAELKLQLMLLQEENARLKAARHQPAGIGTAIDRVRLLNSPAADDDMLDDAWTLLSDCLVIREGLDQACAEIQSAIESVRDRLTTLAVRIESTATREGADATRRVPS